MADRDLGSVLAALADRRAAAHGTLLVGLAGGVAVGKSTLAAQLAEGLAADGGPVQVVATDGFLKPNRELAAAGSIHRKGFPETYDWDALHGFLDRLADGRPAATPVYSHVTYDIVPGETRAVEAGGVVIVEGLNVLQTREARRRFGLSLYLDADPDHVKAWFLRRLDEIVAREPQSFIAQIKDEAERRALIEAAWRDINLVNLRDHIAPTMAHADVVVRKGPDHAIAAVEIR
ncbi:MAG: hypothetical protein JF588_02585 [Caulobacterales bacterium]|nr:hypothetical protein [Caulobacterales bacterium]